VPQPQLVLALGLKRVDTDRARLSSCQQATIGPESLLAAKTYLRVDQVEGGDPRAEKRKSSTLAMATCGSSANTATSYVLHDLAQGTVPKESYVRGRRTASSR
jgi:hypothetical protein